MLRALAGLTPGTTERLVTRDDIANATPEQLQQIMLQLNQQAVSDRNQWVGDDMSPSGIISQNTQDLQALANERFLQMGGFGGGSTGDAQLAEQMMQNFQSGPNEFYNPDALPSWMLPENRQFGEITPGSINEQVALQGDPRYGNYIDYLASSPSSPLGYTDWLQNPLAPVERTPEVNPNLFSWGQDGLTPLGGKTWHDVSPHLKVLDDYLQGQPIEAENWQEAVRNSLEGFMRTQHIGPPIINQDAPIPQDPVTMLDPETLGLPGSQFRLGTLQELVSDPTMAGLFFDTGIPRQLRINRDAQGNETSREWINALTGEPLGQSNMIDPLLGLDPDTKLLAFEDVPIGSPLEQIIGPIADFATDSDEDFNDFIFSLDIGQYEPAPEDIIRGPEVQMAEFFNTPAYRMMFGNDPQALDPFLSPSERFQADPGYQFMQDEGLRQLERRNAAKGMLESGPGLRSLMEYSQGLADQSYNQYLGRLNNTWANYQNGLQGIAQQGAQFSNPALGTQLAQLTEGAGGDLSSILGNQGIFGGNAIFNTGGAMANTSMQAASLLAQMRTAEAMANAQIQAANAAGGGGGGMGSMLGQMGSMMGGGSK